MRLNVTQLAIIGLLASIVGCGGVTPTPHLNIVMGDVIAKDKKIVTEHCEVQFHPVSGDSEGKRFASPIIDGSYSIRTEEVDGNLIAGVPEGDYVVTINPPPAPAGVAARPLTYPPKYQDPKTSNLTAHVDADQKSICKIDFELVK